MKTKRIFLSVILLTLIFSTSAKADLFDRGGGLIYDSDLDITWLQNANYNGYTMSWADAVDWVEDFDYANYFDWRLPESDSCSGKGCTGSEMGHLFNEEGISSAPESSGPFSNIAAYMYWSGTEYDTDPSMAWRFNFKYGTQSTKEKSSKYYAWAVRDGDSNVPVAPEPLSSILFITGGTIMAIRRKLWISRERI